MHIKYRYFTGATPLCISSATARRNSDIAPLAKSYLKCLDASRDCCEKSSSILPWINKRSSSTFRLYLLFLVDSLGSHCLHIFADNKNPKRWWYSISVGNDSSPSSTHSLAHQHVASSSMPVHTVLSSLALVHIVVQ